MDTVPFQVRQYYDSEIPHITQAIFSEDEKYAVFF
jgi:hypothetical protein